MACDHFQLWLNSQTCSCQTSQIQTEQPKALFSICSEFRSHGVIALLAHATGFPSCKTEAIGFPSYKTEAIGFPSCKTEAPSPDWEASHWSIVAFLLSKKASDCDEVRAFFIRSNALSCSGLHSHITSFRVRWMIGANIVDRPGTYFAR